MLAQILDPAAYSPNPSAVPTAVAAASIMLLGLLVLVRERRSPISIAFFGVTLPVTIWLFCTSWTYLSADEVVALWWAKAAYLGVPFIAPATYHFTVMLLGVFRRYRYVVWLAWLLSTLFCAAALASDALVSHVSRFPWGYYTAFGWLGVVFIPYFAGLLVASMAHYLAHYRPELAVRQRRRIRWLMLAFGIGYTGIVDFVPTYGVPLYPFGYLSILAFVALSARAIWEYRLIAITPEFAAREILDTMGDALLVFDSAGMVSVANKAACELFALEKSDLVGKGVAEALPGHGLGARLREVMGGSDVRDYEIDLSTKVQQQIVSVSSRTARSAGGEPLAVVCLLRDITGYRRAEELALANRELQIEIAERRRAEAERAELLVSEQAARALAEEAVRAREVLLSIVSHDLRNPLAAIRGTTRLLEKIVAGSEHLDSRVLPGIVRIDASANKMNLLINELLDFARLQAGQPLDLYRRDLDLVELARTAAANHRQYTERHTLAVEAGVPRLVGTWDQSRLERALDNLLSNAIKYSPNGGPITISVARDAGQGDRAGESAVITVRDEGIGIPPSDLPHVFDWFHRAGNVSGRITGTGIGLATVRQAVEQHGGTIDVHSVEGKGTTFTIRLPVAPGEH
jgi:PAS domain S-box-containing protein